MSPSHAPKTPLSLLLWVAVCCVLMAWAPAPPEPIAATQEELGSMQRAADIAAQAPQQWRRERGDFTIPWQQARGHLVIVIDDVGRELHLFDQLLSLRFPLTFAVVPGGIYSAGVQVRLQADRRRYREVLLHLPMEPDEAALMREGDETRETFLLASDSPEVLAAKTRAALSLVPTAIGVNNHMGSRLTTERAAMDVVMSVVAQRGLTFLDSRTIGTTVAQQAAQAAGIDAGSRAMFLDHEPGREAIAAALALAAERARTEPTVVIAHPSPEVIDALAAGLPRLHAEGVGVYPLSRLVAERNNPRAGRALNGQRP